MRRAVLGLLALVAAGCTDASEARRPPAPEPAPVAVATVAAVERAVPRVLEVSGALAADTQTDVAAEMPGRITVMPVERGTVVRAGGVLAQLDDQDAQNQLRETEAIERQTAERLGIAGGEPFDPHRTPDVRRARILMERAEADYRRWERLVADGLVSRSAFEEKQTEFATARAQVETVANQMREVYQALHAQRARVAMAKKALADTVIRAPFDGVVAEKHASVGQYVARGTKVATIVRVDPLRVELSIPEGAAAVVKAGQRMSFTVQTYPDRQFEGTIAYVGPALRSESRALVAEALVPNRAGLLQPGLFATARVELPAAGQAVMVPAGALRNAAGVVSLFVAHDGRAEVRFVQIGAETDGWVEIVRGVRAGERVVSAPPEALADGVRVVDPKAGA